MVSRTTVCKAATCFCLCTNWYWKNNILQMSAANCETDRPILYTDLARGSNPGNGETSSSAKMSRGPQWVPLLLLRGFDFQWGNWNFPLTESFRPKYGLGVDSELKGRGPPALDPRPLISAVSVPCVDRSILWDVVGIPVETFVTFLGGCSVLL